MMELTCAYILVLCSLVCATPHGYGTKGGASAKAVASASAGAFDGVRGLPLTIPGGSGYSGSFSKSSSSNFASASSSASSSSSSFSFSGSGSPGFGNNIVNGQHSGCGSGACSSPHGLDATGHSGANAVAGSKAVAGIYDSTNGGCGSGGCSNKNFNGLPSALGSETSGSLQGYNSANVAAGSKGVAGVYDNTNAACASGDCSNKNVNGLPSAPGSGASDANAEAGSKAFGTPNYESGGCSSGSCVNNKVNGISSVHEPDATSSLQGPNAGNGAAGETHGFANGDLKHCTGSDCSNPSLSCKGSECSSNTQTKLPLAHTYDISAKKHDFKLSSDKALNGYNGYSSNSDCTQGNCGFADSKPSDTDDLSNNSGNLNKYNHVPGVPKCDTPNCNGYYTPSTAAFPGIGFGPTKPATYLTTPKTGENCNFPGCQHSFSLNSGKPSSYNVPLHITTDLTKEKIPCNDGNCGTNQYKNPYSTANIGSSALPSGPAGPITCTSPDCAKHVSPSPTPDCKSPNCAPNYASAPTGSGGGLIYQPGVTGSVSFPTNPSYVSSVLPSHTPIGGHYNPECKTPGCVGYTPGHLNAGSPSGPNYVHQFFPHHPAGGPSHIAPSYPIPGVIPNTPSVEHGSTSCTTPNCAPHAPSNIGHYGATIPTTGIIPEHKEPTVGYTGGFGGPAGILKPNEFTGPSNTPVVKPSQSGSPSTVKPSVETQPSVEELPAYTGGFGGPTGILKPNEFDVKHPLTPTHTPAASVNPENHKQPTYTGGFGAPSGLLTPNQISSSTNSNVGSSSIVTPTLPGQKAPAPINGFISPAGTLRPGVDAAIGITPVVHLTSPVVLQPIPAIPAIPASYPTQNALPVATGGVPASIVTSHPNTYFTSNPSINPIVAPGHAGPHGHTTLDGGENLADKNSPAHIGGFGSTPGVLKPNDLSSNNYDKPVTSSITKPTSCSSGNCGVEAGNAEAVFKADAVAYTGGFGGPPGLLKPHDGGKLDGKLLSATQFGLNRGSADFVNSGAGSTGAAHENGAKAPVNGAFIMSGAAAQANAVAQTSASGGATSGTFGNNNANSDGHGSVHGDGQKSGNGCGGGCGGGSYHGSGPDFGSSSALSVAKAGAIDSADAKSHASAVSGARAFSDAGSYASSSASAHASAGYATKGGYGK